MNLKAKFWKWATGFGWFYFQVDSQAYLNKSDFRHMRIKATDKMRYFRFLIFQNSGRIC